MMSVGGALIMALYKGKLIKVPSAKKGEAIQRHDILRASIFCGISVTSASAYSSLPAKILREYPTHLTISALISIVGITVNFVIAKLMIKKETYEWIIVWNFQLLSYVYGGAMISGLAKGEGTSCYSSHQPFINSNCCRNFTRGTTLLGRPTLSSSTFLQPDHHHRLVLENTGTSSPCHRRCFSDPIIMSNLVQQERETNASEIEIVEEQIGNEERSTNDYIVDISQDTNVEMRGRISHDLKGSDHDCLSFHSTAQCWTISHQ